MNMNKFLEEMKDKFRDRGTVFMIPIIDELLERKIEDFDDYLIEVTEKRDSFELYSIDFMYWWSVQTFVVDMKTHFVKSN